MMIIAVALPTATLAFLVWSLARGIHNERARHRSLWREFGLSFVLGLLFLATWIGQLITEWQVFVDEQHTHGEATKIGDFMATFGQSTLENWQSEFLQLFAFAVLAGLYIHKGSAESKDGEEKLEASLRRIEEHLGILPSTAPTDPGEQWKLPETPLEAKDR